MWAFDSVMCMFVIYKKLNYLFLLTVCCEVRTEGYDLKLIIVEFQDTIMDRRTYHFLILKMEEQITRSKSSE
jgi:hypothetical protein